MYRLVILAAAVLGLGACANQTADYCSARLGGNLDAAMMEASDDFRVATHEKTEHPNADQVEENKKKWGVA